MKTKIIKFILKVLANFTLAKFISALITITALAGIKYAISGNLHVEYCNFLTNIGIGLLSFTLNTGFLGLLSEYLGLKGINFNLKQFIFGFDAIEVGKSSSFPLKEPDNVKIKVYLAMESNDDVSNSSGNLDKGKGKEVEYTEAPFSTGSKALPDRDISSLIFSKKTNPGPGFNVPGGVVPISDDICKHINYNSHILNQFKTMDLETAIEQRDNNLILIGVLEHKLAYAQNALEKVPTIPTTERQYNLRNEILKDLREMTEIKKNAEGRATLLSSRIQFIESKIQNN
jgi:hypothetical protein